MYESMATTTKITAVSRVALKLKDNFYTVEFSEERAIPDAEGVNIEEERKILFDDVNAIVDSQCEEIIRTFTK